MLRSLLAIETTGKSGSVALLRRSWDEASPASGAREAQHATEPSEWVLETLDPQHGSARTLVPAIASLLRRCGVAANQLDAVAVISGPGSFTGLRVGIATAKALAYALQIPVLAVDGLDVIAWQLDPKRCEDTVNVDRLFAVVDAYRGQMFAAEYRKEASVWCKVQSTCVLDNEALFEQIVAPKLGACMVAGPGVAKLRAAWQSQSRHAEPVDVQWFSEEPSLPHAASVAHLSWQRWRAGETEDMWGLLPQYYRSSAAEEQQRAKR